MTSVVSLNTLVILFFSLCALIDSTGLVVHVKVNDTVTLEPCPVPEISGAVSYQWVWYRGSEIITPVKSELLKLHENNGSLTVTVSMVDFNHLYGCQGIAILPNGTTLSGEPRLYAISPITPAFLEHELHNSTVPWGENYEIRCKAGGVKSSLEIKVDGRLWSLGYVRILGNTLIECRAYNFFTEEKASAYLTVLPGSKERASSNVLIDRSACKPFRIPSLCSVVLEAEKPEESVYAVSTARLLEAETINQLLDTSFQHWDALVPTGVSPDNPRLRCLQQAKRLVCLLAFPRCFRTEAYIADFKRFDVNLGNPLLSAREAPVCQQHCFLITSLLCAVSFQGSKALPALHDYESSAANANNFPQGKGWKELLAVTPNISHLLPEHGCAGLPRSTRTKFFKLDDPIPRTMEPICQDLSFIDLVATPTSNTLNSQNDCYTGQGVDYRGTAAGPPSCLPWKELDYVRSNLTFDPLTLLSPSVLPPEALNPLPANHSVCRNPLGLATKPFCVGLSTFTSHLEIFACPLLVDCADVNSTTLAPNHVALLNKYQHIKVISIITIVGAFFLILVCFLFFYTLRACRWEKVRVSAEEARNNRRARLVARRVRLREANCCGRCLLRFLFNIQDSCGPEKSCCGGRNRNGKNIKKADGNPVQDPGIFALDDEDEEVHHFREYLNQDCSLNWSVAGLAHVDNQPHLVSFESADGEEREMFEGPFSTLGSQSSFLRPQLQGSGGNSSSLEIFDEKQNRNIHLESALMLVSAGQLMHPRLKQISYSRKLLIEERTLAKSAFGHVILARAPNFPLRERLNLIDNDSLGRVDESGIPYVVVKTLNFGATPAAETSFFREAELLIELDHPNIAKIIGWETVSIPPIENMDATADNCICIPLQPYSLIYEYMPDGDLNTFLHQARESATDMNAPATSGDFTVGINDEEESKPNGINVTDDTCKCGSLSFGDLLRFALDVCEAMVYLSSRLYVHRDLATRNCLVSGGRVKISDFSMAHRLTHGDISDDLIDVDSDLPLAIRWLPLESVLEGRFNLDTDIWSFGIFLWELFTLGCLPYGNVDVSEVIQALTQERRLRRPQNCPRAVYNMMRGCWASIREERPTFRQIRSTLVPLLQHFEN